MFIIFHGDKVDGGWEEWSDWSKCSVSCGKGTHSSTRACTNPVPRNGEACVGKTSRARECEGHLCQGIFIIKYYFIIFTQ
jgi:hypothetical protein